MFSTTVPKSDPGPSSAAECADCHHAFTDRLEMQWDVRLPDGSFLIVCSACFQKREANRAPVDDDAPVEGTTSVLSMKSTKPGPAKKRKK